MTEDPTPLEPKKTKLGQVIGRDIDYDVDQLMEDMDWMLLLIFMAAINLANLTTGAWFFTFDGTYRAFFGKARRYRKNARKIHDGEISMAARSATPAFRNKKSGTEKHTVPMTPGTEVKHDFTQMNGHLYGWSKETFPLVFRPGLMTHETLSLFANWLREIPCKPTIGFADRESGNQKKTQPFRDVCDDLGIGIMFSMRKDDTTKRIIIDHWNSGKAQPIPDVGRIQGHQGMVVFWSVAYRVWNEEAEQFYNMLILYYDRNPQKDTNDDEDSAAPTKLGKNLWATCHVINFEVPIELSRWVYSQVKCYWSCENLHQRTKRHGGIAGGDLTFGRHVIYGALMVHLGTLALWRLERRRRLQAEGVSLGKIKRLVSHTRFFGAVRRHVDDFFRRRHGLQ